MQQEAYSEQPLDLSNLFCRWVLDALIFGQNVTVAMEQESKQMISKFQAYL